MNRLGLGLLSFAPQYILVLPKSFNHAEEVILTSKLAMERVILDLIIVMVVATAAPKRKRLQVRTCPEEGVLPLQAHLVASTANVALSNLPGVVAAPESRELDQVEEQHLVGIAEEEGTVKNEATGNRSSPTPAPSSPGGTRVLSVSTVSIQPNITGENKHETPEKKNAKGDVAITSSSNEKNLSCVLLPFDGNPEPAKLAAAISDIQEVDAGTISSPLLSDSAKQLDVVKRLVMMIVCLCALICLQDAF